MPPKNDDITVSDVEHSGDRDDEKAGDDHSLGAEAVHELRRLRSESRIPIATGPGAVMSPALNGE
jgi:hypothetical protein